MLTTPKRRKRSIDPPPIVLRETQLLNDIPYLVCMTPGTAFRQPWGYKYLPTQYIPRLIGRGVHSGEDRVSDLRGAPHYFQLAVKDGVNFHQHIYRIGPGTISWWRNQNVEITLSGGTMVAHDLMANITTASFEWASKELNIPITIPKPIDLDVSNLPIKYLPQPDWHAFTFGDYTIFIEVDTGSESGRRDAKSDLVDIYKKCKAYLQLFSHIQIKNPRVLFYTCAQPRFNFKGERLPFEPFTPRVHNFAERLKEAIDDGGYDHDFAEFFGFRAVPYTTNYQNIPELSSWAVTEPYLRAGFEDFNFMEGN